MLKLQTISKVQKSDTKIYNKKDSLSKHLEIESFFILFKLDFTNIFPKEEKLIDIQIENLIKAGLKNIEFSWSNKKEWFNFMSRIKLKFPHLNLGSASIINKKGIDHSLDIGLDYSMMKFWDKDLIKYANAKNYLLIPGIKNIEDLKKAIKMDCKIIKIYPVKEKDIFIDISQYKNIDFIAAGDLCISDLKLYKSLGYKSIVIGDRALKNKDLDPKIFEFLKEKKR